MSDGNKKQKYILMYGVNVNKFNLKLKRNFLMR